eukprot:TRINITY_DN6262_c0_g1_i2.p1 TRINITY_DN6262_c0_g1~~TRINITY_DN6262_c0_g1_i2.p1  ORF type:complete len:396 (+),score=51.51 TRINITY_DN6262_c0_g1_i2:133-1320(+)
MSGDLPDEKQLRSPRLFGAVCFLNVVFAGFVLASTTVQKKLVDDSLLSVEEAGSVYDTAFLGMTIGILFFSFAGVSLRTGTVFGLFVQAGGLALLGISRSVLEITVGYTAASFGGEVVFISSLRVAFAFKRPSMVALLSACMSLGCITEYLLLIPEVSLRAFCLCLGGFALLCAFLAATYFPRQTKLFSIATKIPLGFRDVRFWAFGAGFGISSGAVVWSNGDFNDSAAAVLDPEIGSVLVSMFTLVQSASFPICAFLGFWTDRQGYMGPILVSLLSSQLLMSCSVWQSPLAMWLSLPLVSIANASVYMLQGAYLLTFEASEFDALLCGTILCQSVALSLMQAVVPQHGHVGASIMIVAVCIGYMWPVLHASTTCRQRWVAHKREDVVDLRLAHV